jgi:hypothetical protein
VGSYAADVLASRSDPDPNTRSPIGIGVVVEIADFVHEERKFATLVSAAVHCETKGQTPLDAVCCESRRCCIAVAAITRAFKTWVAYLKASIFPSAGLQDETFSLANCLRLYW